MKNSEEKKKRKRKLFAAFVMILFTGVLLSTSTYAWFTANRTVTVETIDVNVTAAQGLQLSVDGSNWKPVITIDDLKNAGATYTEKNGNKNQIPLTAKSMTAVSTIGEVDTSNGLVKMFKGEVVNKDSVNKLQAVQEIEKLQDGGSFIAFDLFFKVSTDKSKIPVYLTKSSKVAPTKNTADKGLQNAARVAFLPSETLPDGTGLDEIQKNYNKTGTGLKIWEPNNDVHTAAAVSHAKDIYGLTITQTGQAEVPYHGVKAPIDSLNAQLLTATTGTYFGSVTPAIQSPASGIVDEPELFQLGSGITKVRVYMWVEGQDVDCEDVASGTSIGFDLSFSMDKTEAGAGA